jgi:hypothetical protein
MQTHANSQVVGTSIDWTVGQARDSARRLCARIAEFMAARADAYAAAALYEELSKLSNAGAFLAESRTAASSSR